MQYLGRTYTKKLLVVYPKFQFNWASCTFFFFFFANSGTLPRPKRPLLSRTPPCSYVPISIGYPASRTGAWLARLFRDPPPPPSPRPPRPTHSPCTPFSQTPLNSVSAPLHSAPGDSCAPVHILRIFLARTPHPTLPLQSWAPASPLAGAPPDPEPPPWAASFLPPPHTHTPALLCSKRLPAPRAPGGSPGQARA